jgi:dodecin
VSDKVYKIIELVGSSKVSIEDAINNAIATASKACSKLDWFEVIETRGYIESDKVKYYQVSLKVGANF